MHITGIGFNRKQAEFYKCFHQNTPDRLILYILKSPAVFQIDNKYTRCFRHSFIIINSNTAYTLLSSGETLIYDWLFLHIDKPAEFLTSYNLKVNELYSLSSHNKTDIFFDTLLSEYYNRSLHANEIINCAVVSIFSQLSKEVKNEPMTEHSPYYEKLLEIRKNIHNMPSEKWTVDMICKKANLSRSYFQFLYREEFGITCINDVIECKINFARQLLENTSHTVANIAKQCGYDNDVHFMRQFKKITGLTPSEYRKEYTKKQ